MARTRTTPSEKAEARETKRQQRRFTRQARSDAKDAQRAELKAALKDVEQLRQDLYAGKYAAGSPPHCHLAHIRHRNQPQPNDADIERQRLTARMLGHEAPGNDYRTINHIAEVSDVRNPRDKEGTPTWAWAPDPETKNEHRHGHGHPTPSRPVVAGAHTAEETPPCCRVKEIDDEQGGAVGERE